MNIRIILLLTVMLLSKITGAQDTTSVKKVNIGDKVPEFELTNLINYPKSVMKPSDFKGKLLILDFWSTGCSSCIASWPKLLKLQEQFKDKIQIVLVNYFQDEKTIQPRIQKWERTFGQKMTLPIAYNDKTIYSLFPHQGVPHVVWIGQEGIAKYITDGFYLNTETIQGILDKKSMKIYEKTDRYTEDIKFNKPLFVDGNGGASENIAYGTIISKYVPGIMGTAMFYSKDAFSTGVMTNASFVRMVRELYGKGVDKYGSQRLLPYARVVLKTADTTSLVSFLRGNLSYENLYNLQTTIKGKKIDRQKIRKKMIADLELYFQVKMNWAKQKMPCLVVSRSSSPITTYVNGAYLSKLGDSEIVFNKFTMENLFDTLLSNGKWYDFPYPIVDETNFKGELGEISFEVDVSNYRLVSKGFEKHGFKFSMEEREVDVLVVSDDI